jgi:gamma-glutamylcyclotransferase (GGCT)/AIG2-like uncharacterized protein YtfP
MTNLFVYGTLREGSGHLRHSIMKNANFMGVYNTKPKYDMIDLSVVVGEIYQVDSEILMKTDMMEGHPVFYKRMDIEIEDFDNVQAYFLPRDEYGHMPKIESGDWTKK